jgi:hypothetical protein
MSQTLLLHQILPCFQLLLIDGKVGQAYNLHGGPYESSVKGIVTEIIRI